MSRHRNLRQLVDDDDYYDDDDYGDDYDDYDDYPKAPVAPKPKAKATAAAAKTKPAAVVATKKTTTTTTPATKSSFLGTPPGIPKTPSTTATTTAPSTVSPLPNTSLPAPTSRVVPSILTNTNASDKQRLTVVVLGHVDAGKSTVTGHLLYGSGTSSHNNNHKINSNTTKTINYAWLLDENPQERAHGITMDIATKTLETPHYQLVLLDAPGHSDHVPAMITGASQADACLLVVDVTDATSSRTSRGNNNNNSSNNNNTALDAGQLKEHVYLARGLGVLQMLVVVNKMDMVGWSQEAFERVVQTLTPFLKQVGFSGPQVRFLPVSGLTGTNVYSRKKTAAAAAADNDDASLWCHQGPTLMQALDEFVVPAASTATSVWQRPFRMVLTDVVGEQGKGVAVRAKLLQGWIKAGDALVVLPLGDATSIQKLTSLQPSIDLERTKYAVAGEVIDCVLQNVDVMRVATGNVVTRPQERPPMAAKCRAMVWILDGLSIPIIRGAQALFHMHQMDIPCHMSVLIKTLKKDGSVLKDRPRALTANTQAIVELTLSVPISMEAFADCRGMGRFVLRRSGQSIAVGRIEEVLV